MVDKLRDLDVCPFFMSRAAFAISLRLPAATSARAHSDGEGFNIQLDAVPIDGKVTLRVPAEKEE